VRRAKRKDREERLRHHNRNSSNGFQKEDRGKKAPVRGSGNLIFASASNSRPGMKCESHNNKRKRREDRRRRRCTCRENAKGNRGVPGAGGAPLIASGTKKGSVVKALRASTDLEPARQLQNKSAKLASRQASGRDRGLVRDQGKRPRPGTPRNKSRDIRYSKKRSYRERGIGLHGDPDRAPASPKKT